MPPLVHPIHTTVRRHFPLPSLGTGLLTAIQAVLPKFPGNVLIIWDAALIFKNCCLAPGPLRVDHAATVATACMFVAPPKAVIGGADGTEGVGW